eukprot:336336_1
MTAIWIFDLISMVDYSDRVQGTIGLAEQSKSITNATHVEKCKKNGVKYIRYDNGNTLFYVYDQMGYFYSSEHESLVCAGFEVELHRKYFWIMELSNGILKFGIITHRDAQQKSELRKLQLREAFRVNQQKKYKLCVYLQDSTVELTHSAFESFSTWRRNEIQNLPEIPEITEHKTIEMTRYQLQKVAKEEAKRAKKEEKKRKKQDKKAAKLKELEMKTSNNGDDNLPMNEKELRRYKKKEEMQKKHNWTTLLTVLIALFSAIGSIALTDSLGLSDEYNGVVVIIMCFLSLCVAIIKIYLSWNASYTYFDANQSFYQSIKVEEKAEHRWISYSLKMKAIAVFIATITDIMFDILQGIAATQHQQYTNNAFYVLVVSTWIGVGDEIVECFVEIFFMSLQEIESCEISFCVVFLLWSITESVMGCYLLSTYDDDTLRVIGMSIEINLIIFSILFLILFAYWHQTKKI